MQKLSLPIDAHLGTIRESVANYSTVMVKASPGSGKTTRLPWFLAREMRKRVVVLEPRRLAAKLAALRIAEEESLTLGHEVGYHFRFEKMTSLETQLIFYTEGTFLKKFLQDPLLRDIDIVILDEFHERHLDTDLALGFLRELQQKRPELKIILMSATLDLKMLENFPNSKVVDVAGVMHPVGMSYLPNVPSILNQSLEQKIKKAVDEAQSFEGDILIFLPGMREMLRVKDVLQGDYDLYLLHADLSKEEQHEALSPSRRRKIILATNIAESSVTIPGIRIVIDSGIQREAYYSPWNGLKFIHDVPVTKSSAIQRMGRAGRTAPGHCFRLYSQQDFNEREDHTIPEIEKADLTDTYLLVKGTGLTPLWFHEPPKEKWEKAKLLCERLGATDQNGITSIGKKMLEYPLDARLSRILIEGINLPRKNKEKLLRYICEEIESDKTGVLYRRLHSYLKEDGTDTKSWEECILVGFVDQVARFRKKQRDFIHYSGKTIKLHSSLDLHDDFYIIFDITARQEAIKVLSVEETWLWNLNPFPFTEEDEISVNDKIQIKRKTKCGSIVIEETPIKLEWSSLPTSTKEKISIITLSTFKNAIEGWKEGPVFERFAFWAKSKNISLDELEQDLTPIKYFDYDGSLTWENFEHFLQEYFEQKLDIQNIDRELPLKINLGGKRELTVHYPLGMEPYLEAPIQDFYGLNETPSILSGKQPLTLKLLGPHKRPIQVTKDLKNFWQKTYQEMKKEYQRDYPRHYWPDKPWEAKPILLKRMLEGS